MFRVVVDIWWFRGKLFNILRMIVLKDGKIIKGWWCYRVIEIVRFKVVLFLFLSLTEIISFFIV